MPSSDEAPKEFNFLEAQKIVSRRLARYLQDAMNKDERIIHDTRRSVEKLNRFWINTWAEIHGHVTDLLHSADKISDNDPYEAQRIFETAVLILDQTELLVRLQDDAHDEGLRLLKPELLKEGANRSIAKARTKRNASRDEKANIRRDLIVAVVSKLNPEYVRATNSHKLATKISPDIDRQLDGGDRVKDSTIYRDIKILRETKKIGMAEI